MAVKPLTKKIIFLVWILFIPAGMWFTFHAYPPQFYGEWLEIAAFLLLTLVVASMPMVINNSPIFLIQWMLLAAFLHFGLFVEMIFAQAAVLVLMLKLRIQKEQIFRLPLNLIMFFIVSFLSGAIYYFLGGQPRPDLAEDSRSFWLGLFYAFTNYFLNQILVSINLYFIYKSKESYFGKAFIVETITSIITFPIGMVLYILYNQVELLALLFVGVPFVSLSIIFNLYYSSEQINEYLQKAAEIGHQMAERLQINEVIDLFIHKLSEMLPVDYAYIFEVSGDELKLTRRFEAGEIVSCDLPSLKNTRGIIGRVWSKQKAFLYSARMEWRGIENGYLPDDAESILCVPILRNRNVIGIVMLVSKQKRAYEKFQLMIIDILCSYFAVAMENAKHYELTRMQSERCSLTKLYNYRYFENMITDEFERLARCERQLLSLIILDIDHFKHINDMYGHQSGNEILCELAGRISKLVGGRGTAARYGGEEFVVLLPDSSKEEAYQMAEHIRQAIANWPFTLSETLDQKQQQVRITASIGVATAPEDAEDPLALVRHADRALYVGAKREGRNRVAEYSSC